MIWPSIRSPCAILLWLEALEGPATPRFRTIQVCPKDQPGSLWQAEVPENRAQGSVGRLIAHGRKVPMLTARVHHAARRRGGGVAARGARAAGGDAGDRISPRCIVRGGRVVAGGTPPGLEGNRLRRRPQRRHRISPCEQRLQSAPGTGGRLGSPPSCCHRYGRRGRFGKGRQSRRPSQSSFRPARTRSRSGSS